MAESLRQHHFGNQKYTYFVQTANPFLQERKLRNPFHWLFNMLDFTVLEFGLVTIY